MSFYAALSLNQRVKRIQDGINTYTPEGRAEFDAWQAISDRLATFLTI